MGIEILRRLAHRGAAGLRSLLERRRGHPHPHPPRPLREDARPRGHRAPARGRLRRRAVLPLARPGAVRRPRCATLEEAVRHHNQKVIGWRDVPVDASVLGPVARASMPVFRQLFVGRMCPAAAFERTLFMIRKRAGRRASEAGSRGFYIASLSSKTVVYKGLALPERLDRLLPRPSRGGDAQPHRARPLALQHEHVPHLGARAPLPAHRPQRRDQHAARQPDLDARARAAPRERGLRRAPRRLQAHHPPRRERLGLARQRGRLPRRRRAQPAARDDDARPRGVGGPRRHAARAARLLRVPRVAGRAVGRTGGAALHRRPTTSARRSTATASAR